MERGYALIGHRLNPTYSLTKVMWVRDHEPEVFARVRARRAGQGLRGVPAHGRAGDRSRPTRPAPTRTTSGRARGRTELLGAGGARPRAVRRRSCRRRTVVGAGDRGGGVGDRAGRGHAGGAGRRRRAVRRARRRACRRPSRARTPTSAPRRGCRWRRREPLHDPAMRTMTFDHVIPGRFVPTATMQAGGASFEWISELLEETPGRRWARRRRARRRRRRAVFLPYLLGERSPYWNPRARAARSSGCSATTAGRSSPAPCSRASRSTCASGWTRSRRWAPAIDVGRRDRRRRGQRHVAADPRRRVGQAGPPALAGRRGQRARRGRGGRCRRRAVRRLRRRARLLRGRRARSTPDPERHERYGARHALFLDAYRRLETPRSMSSERRRRHVALVRERRRRPGGRAARRRARRRQRATRHTTRCRCSDAVGVDRRRRRRSPPTHLDRAPRLRVIARFGTGVDAVDVRAAAERGVVVTRTPGANADSVADHAVALMLAALRDVVAADAAARAGDWRAAPRPGAGRADRRRRRASARSGAAWPGASATASAPACSPTTRS